MTAFRIVVAVLWLASVLVAFQLGRQQGGSNTFVSVADTAAPVRSIPPAAADSSRQPTRPAELDEQLLLTADVQQLAADVYQQGRGDRLLAALLLLADTGNVQRALQIADVYAALDQSAQVKFLLSDLHMMQAQIIAALEPLFQILDYPETPEIAQRARQRIDLIVNAQEQQWLTSGDTVAALAFFQWLVTRAPGYDGYRLKLARWLLESGDLTAASNLLQQTGAVGVTDAQREALAQEIVAAAEQLPIERQGSSYYASVAVRASAYGSQQSVRMLVDTGATNTSMVESLLIDLGAQRLPGRVRVATAGGVTEMATYQVDQVSFGGRRFQNLVVLGLPHSPGGAQGLLGMDVLGGFPKAVGTP